RPASTRFPYTTLFRSALRLVNELGLPQAGADGDADHVRVIRLAVADPTAKGHVHHAAAGRDGERGALLQINRIRLTDVTRVTGRSEEHTSELQSPDHL